jgi:hypothetical protein
MRLLLNAALALLLPVSAHAARAVMENIAASNNTVFVDTQTKRVHLSTQAYGDGVPTVSFYTTSNVVVGDGNAIVLYATGSFNSASLNASSLVSVPLVAVSSISASGALRVFTNGGTLALYCDTAGDCAFGGVTNTSGDLDVSDPTGASFDLRRADSSVDNGNTLGVINFWSEDTSTGGTAIKARIRTQALATYGSADQAHPAGMFFGISNTGGNNATDYMVLTSTSLRGNDSLPLDFSSASLRAVGNNVYSLTTSSGVHILAGGILWPDGTVSTTAVGQSGGGSGSGDMVLASTQTVSAAKIHTSSVTAGPSIFTSTAITSGLSPGVSHTAVFVNGWTLVASTNPSNAPVVHFSGLRQGVRYRLEWDFEAMTSGVPAIRWNAVSAGYQYASRGMRSDGSAIDTTSTSQSECGFTGGGSIGTNRESHGHFEFHLDRNDASIAYGYGWNIHLDNTPQLMSTPVGCYLDAASSISSIQFIQSSMTGIFRLYEKATAQP